MTEAASHPYAVIETGGKQYRVAAGDRIDVEKLPQAVGEKVTFDKVLFVAHNGEVTVGRPQVPNASVTAEIVAQGKGEKIIVYKFKRRKGYDKKTGHRQLQTTLKITKINS